MDMTLPPVHGEAAGTASFLLAGGNEAVHAWLSQALASLGTVHDAPGAVEVAADGSDMAGRIAAAEPAVVFMHFAGQQALACTRLGQRLSRLHAGLPLVAVGDAKQPELMLAALRAGVKDFIDMSAPASAAVTVVQRLLREREQARPARRGKVLAVLGARPGVGATTLALHLAAMARAAQREVLLLDLGLPARDGALYANLAPGFDFVEAVRNLRRFDQVFVQTALTRHPNGMALLPLPATLAGLRDIAFAEALALVETLRGHFDLQVIDLGGFGHLDGMAQLVKVADEVLLVAEQSVAAIVSAAELVEELERREAGRERIRLVVSRLQPGLGIDAAHMVERLGLPLAGTLPDCRERLLAAINAGVLLDGGHSDDMYADAVRMLLGSVGATAGAAPARAPWHRRAWHALSGFRLPRGFASWGRQAAIGGNQADQ